MIPTKNGSEHEEPEEKLTLPEQRYVIASALLIFLASLPACNSEDVKGAARR